MMEDTSEGMVLCCRKADQEAPADVQRQGQAYEVERLTTCWPGQSFDDTGPRWEPTGAPNGV